MKIIKVFSALIIFSFVLLKARGQVDSTPNAITNDLYQNKIDLKAKQFLLFSYFTGQAGGAHLALSIDGLHWEQLNGG